MHKRFFVRYLWKYFLKLYKILWRVVGQDGNIGYSLLIKESRWSVSLLASPLAPGETESAVSPAPSVSFTNVSRASTKIQASEPDDVAAEVLYSNVGWNSLVSDNVLCWLMLRHKCIDYFSMLPNVKLILEELFIYLNK